MVHLLVKMTLMTRNLIMKNALKKKMGVGWKVLHSIIHKLAKGKSTHKPQQGVPALLTSTATKEGIWYRFLCCISM